MLLRETTREDFDRLDKAKKLIAYDYARRFALLDLGACTWGLSWRSDLIEPVLRQSADGRLVWIGVDQGLAAVNVGDGSLAFAETLVSNILDIKVCKSVLLVLCEIEVVTFTPDGSSRMSVPVGDLPRQIIDDGDQVRVELVDGSFVAIGSASPTP